MPPALPPYVLETPAFRFVRLAAQAGRAPVGGGREVALASYLLARMVHDALIERAVPGELRGERAKAAKSWLSSIALGPTIRAACSDLAAATAGGQPEISPALRRVIAVTASSLDPGARLELERLAAMLDSQPVGNS